MCMLSHNASFRHAKTTTILSACTALLTLTGCGAAVRTAATSASAPASTLTVAAPPRLGYAWNPQDKTLRAIEGIPGAAQFGESITTAGTFELGEADPTGSTAVLLGQGQSMYTVSLPGGSPVLLTAKAPAGSKVVFSPQGTYALVFPQGGVEGRLLTQFSGTLQVKTVTFSTPINDAVVSDAGSVVTAQNASNGVLVQATGSSGLQTVSQVKALGGMSFIAGTDDLLIADAASNSLLRVRSASSGATSSQVPTSDLLKTPASLSTSRSARWAVLANGADGSVVRIDLTGSTPAQRTACNCQASLVRPLTADGVFRLTALQDGPVWIGDSSKALFPVLFIPALPGQAKAAR